MTIIEEIQALADANGMEIGLAAHHLESDQHCELNAETLFPMASVLKIPILATAFQQYDQGYFYLDDRWSLSEDHKRRGSGILPFFGPGLTPTVHDLLTLMIIISDNTATDMVLARLGGPEVVERTMHDLGLTDIYLKLTIKALLGSCLPELDPELDDVAQRVQYQALGFKRDSVAFSRGPDNDVSTARAMTQLLGRIFRGDIANRSSTDQMLAILSKQQFRMRLPRFLPPEVGFVHKTGTLGGVRNDSGLMTINEGNHVALTLYTIWDDEAVWGDPVATQTRIYEVETAMGQIGRLIYEHFRDS